MAPPDASLLSVVKLQCASEYCERTGTKPRVVVGTVHESMKAEVHLEGEGTCPDLFV